MGVLKNGISGAITGPVGEYTYYEANGLQIIRKRRNNTQIEPAAPGQLNQRQKMKVMNRFLKPVAGFVKIGFAHLKGKPGAAAYHQAQSVVVKHAFVEDMLDYSKIILSIGSLPQAIDPMLLHADGKLIFRWQAEQAWPVATDRVMILAYCEELVEGIYNVAGMQRSKGEDVLELPLHWKDKIVHAYLSFTAEDQSSVSSSQYLGDFIY